MDEKNEDSIGYEFKAKIMITSVLILFLACFIIVLFHVYNRWFRHLHRPRGATFSTADVVAGAASQGLDIKAMNSLPTFVYKSEKNHGESPPECAVCLSEFEENESGRVLPECRHCFHIRCIDMWLLSHCDCPLCRARVRVQHVSGPVHVAIDVVGNMGTGSGSGFNPNGIDMGCASSSIVRGQDSAKVDGEPESDPGRGVGSDIESGSNGPVSSVWVLKRLLRDL